MYTRRYIHAHIHVSQAVHNTSSRAPSGFVNAALRIVMALETINFANCSDRIVKRRRSGDGIPRARTSCCERTSRARRYHLIGVLFFPRDRLKRASHPPVALIGRDGTLGRRRGEYRYRARRIAIVTRTSDDREGERERERDNILLARSLRRRYRSRFTFRLSRTSSVN